MTTLVSLLFPVGVTIWVARDAKNRGIQDRAGWIVGVLLLTIFFFPRYLLTLRKSPAEGDKLTLME